jgi:hypothetical protein
MAEALPKGSSGKFTRQGQTSGKNFGSDPSVNTGVGKSGATDLKP